jgi:hypothetical protein
MTNTATIEAMRQQQAAPREAQMPAVRAGFFDLQSFELIQRVSKAFAQSDLVPKQYQGNLANCMIAMDMAQRIGANPLMVMQNLYVVHGTPGWSSKFLIATINVCGRYSSLRYEWRGKPGEAEYGCRAWAIEKETGERLDGIWVDWKMVKAEGWDAKNGSKWKTMPDQMLIYRAAAFWQRAYAPEFGMGLQTYEELQDTFEATREPDGSYSVDVASLKREAEATNRVGKVDTRTGEIIDAPATAVADPGDDATRTHEQNDGQPMQQDGPSFEDAIAAVKAGDFDLARDLARSLTEGQRKAVEQAIANAQRPKQPQRRERVRGGLVIE